MHRTTILLTAAVLSLAAVLSGACGSGDPAPAPTLDATSDATASALTVVEPSPTPAVLKFRPATTVHLSLPPGYRIESLVDGLEFPAALSATPDGRLLIAEQTTGKVRVFRNGALQDAPWLTVPVSFGQGFVQELGLTGILVDPEFAANGYVYLYYTTAEGDGPRHTTLVRYRDLAGRGVDPKVLLRIDRETERAHVAGGLTFGGGALFVGIGDHENADLAQRLDVITGKILRIDREGAPLPDNPFTGRSDADPRVYAYGVRNPFGMSADPATGQVYFTDNRDAAGDAVYALAPGTNYGWPVERLALIEPLLVYEKPMGLAGAAFYSRTELPELTGSLLFCSFHFNGMLHWSDVTPGLQGTDLARRDRVIANGCSSSVAVGADGFVYYLSYDTGRLLRIRR